MTPVPRAATCAARCNPLARKPAKPALMMAFLMVMACLCGGPWTPGLCETLTAVLRRRGAAEAIASAAT